MLLNDKEIFFLLFFISAFFSSPIFQSRSIPSFLCRGFKVPFRFYLARPKISNLNSSSGISERWSETPLWDCFFVPLRVTNRKMTTAKKQKVTAERKFWRNYLLGIFPSFFFSKPSFAPFPRVSCVWVQRMAKKCAIAHDASASCMKDEKETAEANVRWEKREKKEWEEGKKNL